jgi:hypothetical protein
MLLSTLYSIHGLHFFHGKAVQHTVEDNIPYHAIQKGRVHYHEGRCSEE